MKRKTKSNMSLICVLLCLLGATQCTFAETIEDQSKVSSIEVQLEIKPSIYEGLQERIEFTIGRVGEKILLDQQLYLLKEEQEQVTASMRNVFAEALTGFSIESFELDLAEHTKISMTLLLQQPSVSRVESAFEFRDVPEEIKPFLLSIGENVAKELDPIFLELPVDSLQWSGGIIETVAEYLLERDFPGFILEKADKVIVDNTILQLRFSLKPSEEIVKDIRWRYVSKTIPVWMVRPMLRKDEPTLECLKNLPIEFVVHYQEPLKSFLLKAFTKNSVLKQMDIWAELQISPGQRTEVLIDVNSLHWRTAVEGRVYFGDGDFHYSSVRLGYETTEYQLYLQKNFGEHLRADSVAGVKIPVSSNFLAGFEYELKNNQKSIDFYYNFERGDYFFLKLGIDDAPNEACIGLRINSRMNLELISYDKKYGVNVMFHLW